MSVGKVYRVHYYPFQWSVRELRGSVGFQEESDLPIQVTQSGSETTNTPLF